MTRLAVIPLIVITLILGGCYAKSRLPIEEATIELKMPVSDLVCNVRNFSEKLNLSFHYGTSSQPYGTLATFRLIGSDFEIILYNPENETKFYLSLYSSRRDNKLGNQARMTFQELEHALRDASPGCEPTPR